MTVPSGSVISQDPAAGADVVIGSAVALVISSGLPHVAVPDVVNQPQAAASSALTAVGLTVGAITTASSMTVPSGSVISQDPAAGADVVIGSAVALVISSGLPHVAVPDVVNQPQAAATSALTARRADGRRDHDGVEHDGPERIGHQPGSGGRRRCRHRQRGRPRHLLGSAARRGAGRRQSAAGGRDERATSVGLTVGAITTASSMTVPSGSVISQDPAAGADVVIGSAVALVISSGLPHVAVPDVVNQPQAAASSALTRLA